MDFLRKLLGRIRNPRRRAAMSRRLRMEGLERRELMASDLAQISGLVYTDLTDNGQSVDDTPIAGATVRLFRDGGDALFNNGGGDDLLVDTAITDANGAYVFDALEEGLYFVEQLAVAGRLQRTTETVKTINVTAADALGLSGLVIDSFTGPQSVSANNVTPNSANSLAFGVLGGERELAVSYTSAQPGTISLEADDLGSGVLEFNSSVSGGGLATVTYDGADGDPNTLDFAGLNNLDLTGGGNQVAFRFLIGTDVNGGTMDIRVYSTANDFSTLTVNIPNNGGAATDYVFARFADFIPDVGGAGANFASVNALQFEFNLVSSQDGQLDTIETVGPTVLTTASANLLPMAIGDLVFRDVNNNGLRDVSETGIANVTLELYEDTNNNGDFDIGVDTLLDTTTTNASGLYRFDDLFPGDYLVVVPSSMFQVGGPLFGHVTSTDPAPDPNNDVNDDDNGQLVGAVVATAAITLTAGGEPTNDGDTDPNTNLSIDFGFVPQVDLQVIKTGTPSPVAAGNQVTYTLTAVNDGPATATNVVVTDPLPAGTTFVSASSSVGTVAHAGGTVTANLGTLTAGQSATIDVIVSVSSAQLVPLTNTATITGSEVDTNPANNSASVNTAVVTITDLQITKTDTPDPVVSQGTLTYILTALNNGPSDATGVTVVDVLPAGVTFVAVTSSQGTVANNAGTITAALGNLTAGQSATVTITVSVDPSNDGPILNTGTVTGNETDPDQNNNSSTTQTNVTQQVDVSLTKSASAATIVPGQQLTYTILVTNSGPSTATDVTVTDTLPAGVTFVSATSTLGTAAHNAGTITGSIGTLNVGQSATVTVIVGVNAAAPATLTNTATVTTNETDTNPANNSDTETVNVDRQLDVSITKGDTPDPVIAGQNITYTLTVANAGPSDATGVVVTDALPAGLTFVSATSTQGTATHNAGTVTGTLGTIANGGSATITIVATVGAGFTGTLSNTATVTSGGNDINTANNSATQTTTVNREVDLRVTKVDNPDPVVAGNSLVYSITVFNDGPSDASGVTVTDVLPAGVTFTSVAPSQGTAAHNGGTVTANLGNLPAGTSATVTLTVATLPTVRGTITNTVSVTGNETDPNPANNSATATTAVNTDVDLAITKTDNVDPVLPGQSLTYTITVTNSGVSTATGVTVTDVLPAGITFASGTATSGTVTNAGQTVTGSLGSIAPGASVTMTLVGTVSSSATGTLTNTATVVATEPETNTANNSATQTTAIAELSSLSGNVYFDANGNGIRDAGEVGIAGVTINLSGTDQLGNAVNLNTTTDANGDYSFTGLLPGTYTLSQTTQPSGFADGQTNIGTGATGTPGINQVTNLVIGPGANAVNFNFGEILNPLSKRRFLASSSGND
jgi:uncharacterized repeat protein (TIGR01451 family)